MPPPSPFQISATNPSPPPPGVVLKLPVVHKCRGATPHPFLWHAGVTYSNADVVVIRTNFCTSLILRRAAPNQNVTHLHPKPRQFQAPGQPPSLLTRSPRELVSRVKAESAPVSWWPYLSLRRLVLIVGENFLDVDGRQSVFVDVNQRIRLRSCSGESCRVR